MRQGFVRMLQTDDERTEPMDLVVRRFWTAACGRMARPACPSPAADVAPWTRSAVGERSTHRTIGRRA